jgi:hypothetical protein
MKKLLLSLLLAIPGYTMYAQAPAISILPTNGLVCAGHNVEINATYSGNATTTLWEESSDGAASWHAITPNSTYSISNGPFFPGISETSLFINGVPVSMSGYLYRVTLSNADGSSGASPYSVLLVAQAPPSQVSFLNPRQNVCLGQTIPYVLTGMNVAGDSIYWYYTGSAAFSAYGASSFADTTTLVNFTSTGTYALKAYIFNGCGGANATPNPLPITVNPLQNTPAASPGGGPVCTNYSVFSGASTSFSDATCSPVAVLNPSGSHPLTGNVQSCVTVDATVQSFGGIPYVPRHYSLTSSLTDPTNSTATVTLYFAQSDFDAYNAARGSNPALPTMPSDATGISNLHVTQFHGTGTTPDTYVGGSGDIDPDDNNIIWNATASRWEVTFDITGFSGFFVSGSSIVPLPLTLTDLSGKETKAGNQLHWTTSMEENTAYFEVEREAAAGAGFVSVGKVLAAGNSNRTVQYDYTDVVTGDALYRLKMVDIDGKFTYSRIVALGSAADALTIRVLPNPAHQPLSLAVGSPEVTGAVLTVMDISGKKMLEKHVNLQKGNNSLDPGILATLPQGIYLIGVATDKQQQTIKFVRE